MNKATRIFCTRSLRRCFDGQCCNGSIRGPMSAPSPLRMADIPASKGHGRPDRSFRFPQEEG